MLSTRRPDRAAVRDGLRSLGSSTTGTARVWALTVVLGVVSVILASVEAQAGEPFTPPVAIPWWLLAGIFFLTEAKVVHLHIDRKSTCLAPRTSSTA